MVQNLNYVKILTIIMKFIKLTTIIIQRFDRKKK
jgi:hypothetical protein